MLPEQVTEASEHHLKRSRQVKVLGRQANDTCPKHMLFEHAQICEQGLKTAHRSGCCLMHTVKQYKGQMHLQF